MVFSSIIFLFFFLPVALILHLVAGRHLRNTALLAVSLIFYAWGEELYVLLMLSSILINYLFGILISRGKSEKGRKVLLAIGVTKDLQGRFKAGALMKEVAKVVGGGGGGRPDFARGQGRKPENVEKAFRKLEELVAGS